MTSFAGEPLTEEEEYLLEKFKILREKKKLLQKLKERAETKVKPTVKRESAPIPSITPEDAKRKAEMLVASGCVKISKTSVSREFKRARTSEKKVVKDSLSDQELPVSVERKAVAVNRSPNCLTSSSQTSDFEKGFDDECSLFYHKQPQSALATEMKEMYRTNFVKSGEKYDNGSHDSRGYTEHHRGYRGPKKGNTIFIKGYGLTEEIVRNEFHKFGTVTEVRFERERRFGFVTYESSDEAEKAIKEMNGERVSNVNVHVSYARKQFSNDRGDNPMWSRESRRRDYHGEEHKGNRELQRYEDGDDFF